MTLNLFYSQPLSTQSRSVKCESRRALKAMNENGMGRTGPGTNLAFQNFGNRVQFDPTDLEVTFFVDKSLWGRWWGI